MQMCQWNKAYVTITNKLNKKHALSNDEIDELLDIIESVQIFIDNAQYEVLKRQ